MIEDSTDSSGSGEEWLEGQRARKVEHDRKMMEVFAEDDLRRSLRGVMESDTNDDSEFDMEDYEIKWALEEADMARNAAEESEKEMEVRGDLKDAVVGEGSSEYTNLSVRLQLNIARCFFAL